MDKCVMEDRNPTTSDLTAVAKSCIALIESHPSELDNVEENHKTDKCGHFSIRGFVAEVRRKDRKICWPFPTVDNCNKLEEQTLPPLHVPEFRWWRCHNCVRKIDAKDAPMEIMVLPNCCNIACSTKTSTLPEVNFTLSCGDAQKLDSGFQQPSEINIVDGRKSSSDVSLHVNNAVHSPALFVNSKEKGAEVEHPVIQGIHRLTDGIPEENLNLAICKSINSPKKDDTCLERVNFAEGGIISTNFQVGKKVCELSSDGTVIASLSNSHEKRAPENVTHKSKDYELVNSCSEILHNESVTLKSKCDELVDSSKDIFHIEKREVSRTNLDKNTGQHKDVVTSSLISEVDKEASNAVMCETRKLHSLVPIDNSSESDENLAGEHFQDQCLASLHGNSGDTSHGSKPRKVRLLTDIIRSEVLAASSNLHYTERDATTGCMKTGGAQYEATPDAPSGMFVYPVTNNQVAFQETDKKAMLGKRKKHKLLRDQDEGSSKMDRQRGEIESNNILEEDSEIRNKDTTTANGELAGDASVLVELHPCSKGLLGKHRNGKKLIRGMEGKEMSQVEDSLFSLTPLCEVIPKEVEIRKDARVNFMGSEPVSSKSLHDGVAGKHLIPDAQSYLAAREKGQNLVLDKKKSKVPQFEDEKSFIIPWQEGMPHKDLIIKKYLDKKPKGALSDGLKSVQVPCTGKGIHPDLKRHMRTPGKGTLNKKQKKLLQVECRGMVPRESCSNALICRTKDSFSGHNYGNATNIEEHSKLSMGQCDQVANKMSESAASDDIPMEIVELMARNQYERRLYYAKDGTENTYCLSETTEKVTDSGLMDCTEALGNEMLRLLHKKKMTKDGSSSGQSEGLTKQKSDACPSSFDGKYDRINFSTSRLEQAQSSSGYKAFSKHQGKVPSQVQFPAIGRGAENCSWDGDMVGQRCFSNSGQSLGAYHTSQVVLQQSSFMKSQSVWSSSPNRMPFESNSPQKLVSGSNSNRHSQSPNQLPKGYLNWEMNEGAHPDYLFGCTDKGNVYHPKMRGPLDLYANETLSAMFLLRLMHAGVSSSNPLNMNDNPERFPKGPFPHDQIINELPGPEASVSKTNRDLVDLPSCDYHGKSHLLGNSCEHFPPVSIAKAVDSSVPKNANFQRINGLSGGFLAKTLPCSRKHQKTEGKKRSYSSARTRGPKLHMSASRDSHASENCEYMMHNLKKGFQRVQASNSTKFPEQSQTVEGSTKHVQLEISRKDETVSARERIGGIERCTLNRNPADFTVPEYGNVYMIGVADLKYRKKIPLGERCGLINMDGHKRQKKMKLTTIKEKRQI